MYRFFSADVVGVLFFVIRFNRSNNISIMLVQKVA